MVQVPREGFLKDAGGHLMDGLNAATGVSSAGKGTTGTFMAKVGDEVATTSTTQVVKAAIHGNSKASLRETTLYRL